MSLENTHSAYVLIHFSAVSAKPERDVGRRKEGVSAPTPNRLCESLGANLGFYNAAGLVPLSACMCVCVCVCACVRMTHSFSRGTEVRRLLFWTILA